MKRLVNVKLQVSIPGMTPELRHDINVTLEMISPSYVNGKIPLPHGQEGTMTVGIGKNILGSVLSWLSKVDRSLQYIPAYKLPTGEGDEKSTNN